MIVRRDQILQFEQDRRALTESELFEFLRKEFCSESSALDDQELIDFCRESAEAAMALGFDTFQSIAWFAATRLTIQNRREHASATYRSQAGGVRGSRGRQRGYRPFRSRRADEYLS